MQVIKSKETLNKSSLSRVATKIVKIASRVTQVIAGTTMPRSATRARFWRNPHGHWFCGQSAALCSLRRESTIRCVALLGIVVPATTCVTRLAIFTIFVATRLKEDLFSVSFDLMICNHNSQWVLFLTMLQQQSGRYLAPIDQFHITT